MDNVFFDKKFKEFNSKIKKDIREFNSNIIKFNSNELKIINGLQTYSEKIKSQLSKNIHENALKQASVQSKLKFTKASYQKLYLLNKRYRDIIIKIIDLGLISDQNLLKELVDIESDTNNLICENAYICKNFPKIN